LLLSDFFPKLNNRRFLFLLASSDDDEAEDWLSSLAIVDTLQFCSEEMMAVGKSTNVFVAGKLEMDPMDSK
jgi:hypothetical protein